MFKTILVGLDGSAGSRKALRVAILLAQEHEARLWTVGVEERLPQYPATVGEYGEEHEAAKAYFANLNQEAAALSKEMGVTIESIVRPGHPAKVIIDIVPELQADLIVIGRSGHSNLWGNLLGTTADRVVRSASCSVLVVR
jgi:nucleotide-binding universal stress UspA family protein